MGIVLQYHLELFNGQNRASVTHLDLLPPWLPSDTQSPLLQLRQRDQPQSLDNSENILLFSFIHSSSEWYLMILEDISKLVRHSSDLKILSRTRRWLLTGKPRLWIYDFDNKLSYTFFNTFDMISLTCFRTPALCIFSSSRTLSQWCKA